MSGSGVLVTGAGGEMGRLLVPELAQRGFEVVALDRAELPDVLAGDCREFVRLDLRETDRLTALVERLRPARIFHLAAVLSSHAERDPDLAHRVNVEGTLTLMRACVDSPAPVRFLFPSSIAVYGLPDSSVKRREGALAEWQWNRPEGIYGCNKLYCELVGAYRARRSGGRLDFRAIRFPGLISAETLPSGGTTDYAPEMIHAAAKGEATECFVAETTRLPFMTMPDGVRALLDLAEADAARLSTRVYNIRGFSSSAGEIRDEVRRHFPDARIGFRADPAKQKIVDSWPADVDDTLARADWGLRHEHGLAEALRDYLVPALRRRYAGSSPLGDRSV